METIQKKTSEAQTRANKKYSDKNMKMISVNLNKDVFELLEAGVLKSGINRNKYVTTAILEKLERDGFTGGKILEIKTRYLIQFNVA